MLEIKRLSKHIGALALADGIDLSLQPGERHALIGPNGAGKTSLFHLISGELLCDSGAIIFGGRDITRLSVRRRVALGLARSFQRNNLFMDFCVADNLRFAAVAALGLGGCFWRRGDSAIEELVLRIAEELALTDILSADLRILSYGSLRQLEIAMALVARPSMLLLDEPTAGMSPAERRRMLAVIDNLPSDLTLLMIEHDMDIVFGHAHRITVMLRGGIIMSGEPEAVRSSDRVRALYLGSDTDVND